MNSSGRCWPECKRRRRQRRCRRRWRQPADSWRGRSRARRRRRRRSKPQPATAPPTRWPSEWETATMCTTTSASTPPWRPPSARRCRSWRTRWRAPLSGRIPWRPVGSNYRPGDGCLTNGNTAAGPCCVPLAGRGRLSVASGSRRPGNGRRPSSGRCGRRHCDGRTLRARLRSRRPALRHSNLCQINKLIIQWGIFELIIQSSRPSWMMLSQFADNWRPW